MRPRSGFTLVEMLVVLVVITVLGVSAIQPMSTWMANARVQGMGEQLQNSIRLAQSEAMRRGRQTAFVLTNASPGVAATPVANGKNWYSQTLPLLSGETVSTGDAFIQGSALNAETRTAITGPAVMCFNSIGRQATNGATGLGSNCTAQAQTYAVTVSGVSSVKTLNVTVSIGGQVRLCDTARTLSTSAPDGC